MKNNRGAILGTAVLAALLTLTACGSSPSGDAKATDTKKTTGTPGSNIPALEKVEAIDVKDCTGTPKIAFIGGKTGVLKAVGSEVANGAKLAVDAFNVANPATKVELVEIDTKSQTSTIDKLVRAVAADGCVIGVVGPVSSVETFPIANILDTVDLSLITPSATNPELSAQKWTSFHRALGNDKDQAAAAAKYITETLKSKSTVVISDGSLYGKSVATAVELALGDAVAGTADTGQATDIESIKSAKPTAVFFGGDSTNAAALLMSLQAAGINVPFVGADALLDGLFTKAAGPAAEKAIAICLCAEPNLIEGGGRFVADYTAAFSKTPGLFAIEAFDAANFFLAAVKNGKTDRAAVNKYISSTPFTGLSKVLDFDAKGEIKGVQAYAYVFGKGDSVKGSLIG